MADVVAEGVIKVGVDSSQVGPGIAKIKAELASLDKSGRKDYVVNLKLATAEFDAQLAAARARLAEQTSRASSVKGGGRAHKDALRQIAEETAAINALKLRRTSAADSARAASTVAVALNAKEAASNRELAASQDDLKRSRENDTDSRQRNADKREAISKREADQRVKNQREEEIHEQRMIRERSKTTRELARLDKLKEKEDNAASDSASKRSNAVVKSLTEEEVATARRRAGDKFADEVDTMGTGEYFRKDSHKTAFDEWRKTQPAYEGDRDSGEILHRYEQQDEYIAMKRQEIEDKAETDLRHHRDRRAGRERDDEKKRGGLWRALTIGGSDSIGDSMRKILREPIRIGPFSASIRGFTIAMSLLGPVIGALSGSLIAMTGSIGGAAAAMGGVGIAAIGGYGQALLGVGMIVKPMAAEFHNVSLVTNAYATAVQKYGENSKQANTAQKAMNNTLKNVSPTARAAYKDLAQVQTVFARMTAAARPALDSLLRSAMNAFKQGVPGFAKNSVDATKIASKSLGNVFDRINSARNQGRDPLNTMFVNANKSLGPLIQGLGYLGEALAQIGASAARFLEPMTRALGRSMEGLLDKTDQTASLDKTMESLVDSFKAVGGAISSAAGFLMDFFNAGRTAGDGLFASLGKTFNRWDRFITSTKGKNTLASFFKRSADGARNLFSIIGTVVQAFVFMSSAMAPVITVAGAIAAELMSWGSAVMHIDAARRATQVLAGVIFGMFVGFKIGAIITGFVTALKVAGGALKAFCVEGTISLATMTGGLSLLLGIVGGIGAYMMTAGDHVDGLAKKLDDATKSANDFSDGLAAAFGERNQLGLQLLDAQDALKKLTPGTREYDKQQATVDDLTRQHTTSVDTVTEKVRGETKARREAVITAQEMLVPLKAELEHQLELDKHTDHSNQIRVARKKILEAELVLQNKLAEAAATELLHRRAARTKFPDLPNNAAGEGVRRTLGQLANASKAGYNIAARIAVTAPNTSTLAAEATAAMNALQAGVSSKAIMATINADPTKAEATLNRLIGTKVYKNIWARISNESEFDAAMNRLTSPQRKVVTLVAQGPAALLGALGNLGIVSGGNGGNAEGGVHYSSRDPRGTTAGASGYMKDTAMGNARKRPMRSAMGKFNEPTLLVGEENKTEYVIATNPAYRSQNKKYLAAAASELGMNVWDGNGVEGAAKGRHPRDYYSSARWADAFLDSTDISKEVKKDKRRLKTLKNLFAVYNTPGTTHDAGAKKKHEQQKTEAANLHSFLNSGTTTKNRQNAHMIEYQTDRVAELTSAMALAEKRGDSALYNSSKAGKLKYLGMLDAEYKRAEKYATGDRKSKLRNARFGIESDILDTQGSASDTALASAQAEQYKAQLTAAQNNQLINSAFAGTSGGGMGGFGGSSMAGSIGRTGGAPTIVINTLHPGDPNTVRAIADAATSGMGYQGYTNSARMSSGL